MKQSFYGRLRAQAYNIGDNPPEIVSLYIELAAELRKAGFGAIHVTKAYEHDVVPGDKDGMVFCCQK